MRLTVHELRHLQSKGINVVGGQISDRGRVDLPQAPMPAPPLTPTAREIAEGMAAAEIVLNNGWSFGPITVPGQLYSKSNSRKIRQIPASGKMVQGRYIAPRGRMRPIVTKSDEALCYVRDFIYQVAPLIREPFAGEIILWALVYHRNRQADLDISLLQDCLQVGTPRNQGAGIIKNDRQVMQIHGYHAFDPVKPRTVFYLQEYKSPHAIPAILLEA